MKFLTLGLLWFAVVFCHPAQAQNYVGVVGGVNLSNLDIDPNPGIDFDRLNRMAIGGVIGLQLVNHLKLHIEPMYLQKGAVLRNFDLSLGNSEFKYKVEAFELPVFLRVDLTSSRIQPYLLAGPTAGVITNTTVEVAASGIEFEGDADNIAKTIDFGVGFGGGLSLQVGGQALFLEDPNIALIGYQAHFEELKEGLFYFNHHCHATLALPVKAFENLSPGTKFTGNQRGGAECPR
ncbi:PorT family protein, partial [bacterium]|nr:PorT family protein [bacterium]